MTPYPTWAVSTVAALTFLTGFAGAATAWATAYDRSRSDRLLPGTVIEGVAVGGMRAGEAEALLGERLEAPLHRTVTLRSGDVELETTPWDLGLRADARSAVKRALGGSSGTAVARTWARLFSSPRQTVDAAPRWDDHHLDTALAELAARMQTPPQGPGLEVSGGWLQATPAQPGRELDVERARAALTHALASGETVVDLPSRNVPAAREAGGSLAILIRTGENKLYLYRDGSIVQEWPVATGAAGYPTPTGRWKIVNKLVNPTWTNPGSAWARGMPARIGPGPNNPLGTHALALDAPGILIHATPARSSIGYSASHGCVRMLPEHEVELFRQVEVGTPVFVVAAGPPRTRSATPAAAAPVEAAAAHI